MYFRSPPCKYIGNVFQVFSQSTMQIKGQYFSCIFAIHYENRGEISENWNISLTKPRINATFLPFRFNYSNVRFSARYIRHSNLMYHQFHIFSATPYAVPFSNLLHLLYSGSLLSSLQFFYIS